MTTVRIAALVCAVTLIAAIAPAPAPAQTTSRCGAGVKLSFMCGINRAEDLVQIPGTNLIITSGMADAGKPLTGGLTVIDPKAMTYTQMGLPFGGKARAPFGACPGPLNPETFSAHGLNIRPAGRGRATLYVVGHGGREAIEVFDVVTEGGLREINWAGCIAAPEGARMNSVVPLADGRIIATDFTHAGTTTADAAAGRITGAVYVWKPGGVFTKLPGTDLPGPNGVEVSRDGKQLFVAVTGLSSVLRYDLAATEKAPAVIKTDFRTDNVRWGPDGRLLLAGPGVDADCKPPAGGRCAGTSVVGALDPKTLKLTVLLRTPPEPAFQGLSSALLVGKTLWLGSYQADKVAYADLPK